jgi:hypothetical protein
MPFGLPHAEAQVGEVWMANVTKAGFNRVSFRTKRLGVNAYSIDDKLLPEIDGLRPLFIQRSEAVELDIPILNQSGELADRGLNTSRKEI